MRSQDLTRLVAALRAPIEEFVRESRVRIVLLVNGAGQVLAQHGFTSSYEVMNVASLAAATHASSRALATLCGAGAWQHLHNNGRHRQLFLAPLQTPVGELILVAIFDENSSLGMVNLFFNTLHSDIAGLQEFQQVPRSTDQASFERDLEAGLEIMPTEPVSED
jgi:predicted regulator of Ras-like GTPase activity (Roadblock/LC7/MglB family)